MVLPHRRQFLIHPQSCLRDDSDRVSQMFRRVAPGNLLLRTCDVALRIDTGNSTPAQGFAGRNFLSAATFKVRRRTRNSRCTVVAFRIQSGQSRKIRSSPLRTTSRSRFRHLHHLWAGGRAHGLRRGIISIQTAKGRSVLVAQARMSGQNDFGAVAELSRLIAVAQLELAVAERDQRFSQCRALRIEKFRAKVHRSSQQRQSVPGALEQA